jgi:hypothetical protein
MTDDLVAQLRGRAVALRGVGGKGGQPLRGKDAALDEDAADEIERLRAVLQEVDRLCDYNGACDEIRTIVRAALAGKDKE